VSDSDQDELGSAMNDILSAHSFYQNKGQGRAQALYSPNIGGSPGAPNAHWEEGDNNDRYNQFNGAVLGEIASQKQKFQKRLVNQERQIEQLRSEKSQLAQVLESQRQNFKFTMQQ
jgi:hypothetical protein